jgi:hypothetical protein
MSSTSKKITNIFKKKDVPEISQTEIDKLMGISQTDGKYHTINKNEWKNCIYCEKYHHKDYYGNGIDYCMHCWAWLNAHEYDIEKGVYTGIMSMEDIKSSIKKIYPIHLQADCKNSDCFFNKIKKLTDLKLLHHTLIELLELNKKPTQQAICFNYKNKDLNVNFEESFIVI